jgi:ribonuclease D
MAAPASTTAAAASIVKTSPSLWPLSFSLQLPKSQPKTLGSYNFSIKQFEPPVWWSHRFYRGPEGKEIEVMYSKTRAESEVIAQRFLNEPVIGFDMEWPWNTRVEDTLQNKIGLIQIASEDKIGLFHIGLHPGNTSAEIIAPTLKKIIEDSNIGKIGVNILRADFSRLSNYFGLEPQGAIELSHLYRLTKFGSRKPEYVSVKLVSLAQQVEEQLGLPLYKGDVRTSNWSKPLSKAQIDYAAGDAYAGYMLYKCMNAKRLAMKPTPPPPIYAERYPTGKASRDDPIILDVGDGTTITTAEFFGVQPVKTTPASASATAKAAASRTSLEPLDDISQALYNELLVRRVLLAEKAGVPLTRVVSDILLRAIARARPHNKRALLAIKGVGKVQQQNYGDEWLQVISIFLAKNGIAESASTDNPSASKEKESQAVSRPIRPPTDRRGSSDSSSSVAFDEVAPKPLQLHTGLSFTLAGSNINADVTAPNDGKSDYDSDDTLPSLDFGSPMARRVSSGTKRKRTESPRKEQHLDHDSHDSHEKSPHLRLLHNINPTPQQTRVTHHATPKKEFLHEPSLAHALSLGNTPTSSKSVPTPKKSPSRYSPPPQQLQQPRSDPALSPPSRIAKSKLLAFSRLVASKLREARPPTAPPVVSPHTLDLIVRARPQTQEELERIPGIDNLLLACEKTGMNLLRNVVKFVGERERDEGTRTASVI